MAAKVLKSNEVIPAATARRLLLQAQGLMDDPDRPATNATLFKLIEQMGYVQLDTINVVERAHHLTLFSRLHRYKPAMLAHLLERSRKLFEHWTHDASVIPTQWFPHWHHRYERYRTKIRSNAWWQSRIGENPDVLIAQVKQRIECDGPLLSKDFEHARKNGGTSAPQEDGWWGWKPQKAALEHLWRTGELAVARRVNFQKVYDLTERVLPECASLACPSMDEHVDWACRTAMERLVIATPAEIAAFWNSISLRQATQWCRQAAQSGEVADVIVEAMDGSKPRDALALTNWKSLARRLPNPDDAPTTRLLSPFDPVVRDRKRARRLFNFEYTFEAFTPAPKRRFGYYVLPILEGDRLIGRLNPKLHRDRGLLEIKDLWFEENVKQTKARRRTIDDAVERLAVFIGAERVNFCLK